MTPKGFWLGERLGGEGQSSSVAGQTEQYAGKRPAWRRKVHRNRIRALGKDQSWGCERGDSSKERVRTSVTVWGRFGGCIVVSSPPSVFPSAFVCLLNLVSGRKGAPLGHLAGSVTGSRAMRGGGCCHESWIPDQYRRQPPSPSRRGTNFTTA